MKKILDYGGLEELKELNIEEMEELAKSIREFLIENISITGGHLASNLGVVELTIALHKVFNSGVDKIIWDVGHQCYTHKILTGRRDRFKSLRKYGGMSGFPKRKESIHDTFDTGHSSTSISAGLGIALSRDILREKYSVISVIGDGAMTAGMAFEALNNAGEFEDLDFTIVLNDNEMSISENVGGLSKYLYKVRNVSGYYKFREEFTNVLGKIPKIGDKMLKTTEKAKGSVKYFLTPGMFFEDIGFKYIGPIDGHNLKELINAMEISKKIKGPKIIHVITQKGKGYTHSEKFPEKFHGVGEFNRDTGENMSIRTFKSYSEIFGETLTDLAKENPNIVAITAAMPSGTGLDIFKEKFPERFFDVGIAEQHGVTLAAGMCINKMKPFIGIYSTFLQRSYDQILHDVCIQNLPVVFAIDRAGLVGNDGETHHGVYDISYLSHMPNMAIASPKDKTEFISMLRFASEYDGPLAIRYSKGYAKDFINYNKEKHNEVILGKSEIIEKGENIIIISIGIMGEIGYNLIRRIENKLCKPTLINARFVKPIDIEMIKYASENYELIVTMEDNAIIGGFGSIVNTELIKMNYSGKVLNIGIEDKFIEHGDNKILYGVAGIDEDSIYEKIVEEYERL